MLYFKNLVLVFSILQTVISLNYVEEECVNTYTDDLDNDFLIGTWYRVYQFSFVHLGSTYVCFTDVITKPSRAEVQKYVEAYKLDNPFSFDDNPVQIERAGRWKGMILGKKSVKFFVFDPEGVFYKPDYYKAQVYEKVDDDYILFQECNMRGHVKWLLSRKNSSRDEDLAEVFKAIRFRVGTLETQRFCDERWLPWRIVRKAIAQDPVLTKSPRNNSIN